MHDASDHSLTPTNRKPVVLQPYTRPWGGRWRKYAAWLLLSLLAVVCVFWGYFFAITVPFFLPPFVGPIAFLALLSIWALPDAKTAPTGAVMFLFMAFFMSTMIWPNYLALSLPGLPWITSTRLFGFPLAIAVLVCVSTSQEFRSKTYQAMNSTPRVWQFVTAFAALQVLTIAASKHPVTSMNLIVAYQVSWTLIFFASCFVFLREGSIQRWAVLFWAAALVLCVIGVWENTIGHVPWTGHIPGFLAVGDEYVQRVLAGARRLGTGAYRVQSVQSTSLGLAEFLALATPFTIHFMVSQAYRPALRVAAGLSLPLIFYVIMLTDARLGIVGFFLSVLMYIFAWAVLRWKYVRNSLIGPALTVGYPALAVAFLVLSVAWQRLRVMMWGGNETSSSSQARIEQYSAGIPKVLSHPWGYGPGMGAGELGYTNGAGTLTIDTYYLAVALDYGILGFLVYYTALIAAIYYAARYAYVTDLRHKDHAMLVPVGISLTVFLVIKSIFSQPQNHALQFMMMAIVSVLVYQIRAATPKEAETPKR